MLLSNTKLDYRAVFRFCNPLIFSNTSLNFLKVHFSKIQASDNQNKIKYLILLKSLTKY